MLKTFISLVRKKRWKTLKNKVKKATTQFAKFELLHNNVSVFMHRRSLHYTHNVYVSLPIQSLQTLLSETLRIKNEFITTDYIKPSTNLIPVHNVQINVWFMTDMSAEYIDSEVYDIYHLINNDIYEIYKHSLTIDRCEYAERRIKKLLNAYVAISIILGETYVQ